MSARNKVSIWTARCIPALLALIVAYASWVLVHQLSINYLVNPPRDDIPRRIPIGIALPIVHLALLIPVAVTWLRLLLVVVKDPGYIPQGSGDGPANDHEPRPGLEYFWMKDVFVCDPNGMPIWCAHCNAWKPDRTHHSQDVGRCTRKMDHFCPWIGGVVGERALKFFIQFLFYSAILTCYLTAVFGYFVAQYKRNVHWFVALGMAGFFLLFTLGMVLNSLHFVFRNITTIESVSRRMYLAVVLPPELHSEPAVLPQTKLSAGSDEDSERPQTSDLDDPSHANYFSRQGHIPNRTIPSSALSPPKSKIWKNTITYPLHLPVDRPPIPAPEPRKFAVLHTPPGMNPWDLGSAYRNFTAVFGTALHDWLLPIKFSPCCDHSSDISEFPLGPEFELLLEDAGLTQVMDETTTKDGHSGTTQSRKRKRRLDAGWQNGERPDGWISEKEARRMRNEWRRRAEQNRQEATDVP